MSIPRSSWSTTAVRGPAVPPVLASLVLTLVAAGSLPGEEGYAPGTLQLTPRVDLQLQPVPVHVPERFTGLPRDLVLNLPPGFSASVFAAYGFERPRFMAVGPDGVLHVADMGAGTIVALPDRDGDGVADEAIVAAGRFERAHSLAFYKGAMYVAETHRVMRLTDGDGDGIYEDREILVPSLPKGGWHSTRTIVFDEDRGHFYVGVGWPCDMCRHSDPERGTVLRFNADGSGRRVFASGIRNPIGMALHPGDQPVVGHQQRPRHPRASACRRNGSTSSATAGSTACPWPTATRSTSTSTCPGTGRTCPFRGRIRPWWRAWSGPPP